MTIAGKSIYYKDWHAAGRIDKIEDLLRWLETVSSIFEDLEFDGSL